MRRPLLPAALVVLAVSASTSCIAADLAIAGRWIGFAPSQGLGEVNVHIEASGEGFGTFQFYGEKVSATERAVRFVVAGLRVERTGKSYSMDAAGRAWTLTRLDQEHLEAKLADTPATIRLTKAVFRTWTNSEGKRSKEAMRLESISGKEVTLLGKSDKRYKYSVENLSDDDRKYVKEMTGKPPELQKPTDRKPVKEEGMAFDATIRISAVSKDVDKYKGKRVGWIAEGTEAKITASVISNIYTTKDGYNFVVNKSEDSVIKKTPAANKADTVRFNFRRRVIGTISESQEGLPVLTNVVIDVP